MKKIIFLIVILSVLFGPLDGWKKELSLKTTGEFLKEEISEIEFVQEIEEMIENVF